MMRTAASKFHISVDTGGTFTDVVISDSVGDISVGKAFTTAGRIFSGLQDAIDNAAAFWDMKFEQILKDTAVVVYGTTHATNAVVTGRTARTALLITEGFEDTLFYREGGRIGAFNSKAHYPGPYVPRRLTFGVRERVSAEGEVLLPLDEEALQSTCEVLLKEGVEAVGVVLLWSVKNPFHELRVGEILASALPDVTYSLSHQVNPIMREYRRASSAAIDASLKPLMRRHFEGLSRDLNAAGFEGQFLVVTSEGGVQDLKSVASKPLLAVNSGPSMAPLAGASYAADAETVVVCDIGGTTFDVSLVESGRLRHTRELWLGEPYTGELTGLASVAVKSVGAGGGSIASLDSGGLIRVGPQSAGSNPGPAAYDLGGKEPTITDAAIVLGYLDPASFAGNFALSRIKAEEAVLDRIGNPLGMDAAKAATAIIKVAATRLSSAAHQAILEEGVDPRGAVIVACGGAGPLLGCFIADELEAREVVIPSNAGVLAAYGAHNAEILTEFNAALAMPSHAPDLGGLSHVLRALKSDCDKFASKFVDVAQRAKVEYFTEARYPGQGWEIRVPLGDSLNLNEQDIKGPVEAFHAEHKRRNGTSDPNSDVEFLAWGARVSIQRRSHSQDAHMRLEESQNNSAAPSSYSPVWFDFTLYETPRYNGKRLSAGWRASGPVIVDEPTTTIVVPPAWGVRLLADGSYRLNRVRPEDTDEKA